MTLAKVWFDHLGSITFYYHCSLLWVALTVFYIWRTTQQIRAITEGEQLHLNNEHAFQVSFQSHILSTRVFKWTCTLPAKWPLCFSLQTTQELKVICFKNYYSDKWTNHQSFLDIISPLNFVCGTVSRGNVVWYPVYHNT